MMSGLIRLERHELGPRLHLLGRRVHECHVGLVLLGAVIVAALAGSAREPIVIATALAAWLVVKDWRDLVPSRRDTAAWSLGLHRVPAALRETPRGDWLPALLASLTALVGALNVASVLTPDLPGRERLLRSLAPVDLTIAARALALPTGIVLVMLAHYVFRRRRRAWAVAAALLVALGVLDLIKGLDVEEALAAWALAGLLVWGRDAFRVPHVRGSFATTATRVAILSVGALATALAATWFVPGGALGPAGRLHDAVALLAFCGPPLRSAGHLQWLPLSVGLIGVGTVAAMAALLFAAERAPGVPAPGARSMAAGLVARHGRDTLSFFKLRGDLAYLFSPEGDAFLGYRVQGRTLLVAGDPVGADEALPGLVRQLFVLAESRGLRVVVVGAAARHLDLYRQGRLRAFYMGDEAIVETSTFSLDGRAVRKVRQSNQRLARLGYSSDVSDVEALSDAALAALEAVSERWRRGAPERGFSMAMDSLDRGSLAGSVVLQARDAAGGVRGFLHLVPCADRSAMSLSMMRRDPDAPNGLTEFLIVRAIEILRARDIGELSLNFVAFGRLLRAPSGRCERLLNRALVVAGGQFQIESLYRFNAKFFPRWEPRYLLYEGTLGLVPAGFAALRVEGQLGLPSGLPGRRRTGA